jgi:hypothetical protein
MTITDLLQVTQAELPSIQFPTGMSHRKSLNTSLLEGMIYSKNKRVFIRELCNLTFQVTFNACWASMNIGSKQPIAWKNSRHAPSWLFYLHSGIEETGSPGIICIVCHQVLCHPSEHGTSSMGKHLPAKEYIAKLNEFTVSEVTEFTRATVDETALAILKRQGSQGVPIVSSQRKFKFSI